MIQQLSVFTSEVTRVAAKFGTDGKLGGQAQVADKSPLATAIVHIGNVTHLRRKIAGHRVNAVGEVLPDAAHFRPPAPGRELASVPTSRATRVTSEVKTLNC